MSLLKIAAFSDGDTGGNPAGVMLADTPPSDAEMQRIALELGFSETAFATPMANGWRVRYFSPETEVPFCGHATIALGAALALQHGDGVFALTLNQARITVAGQRQGALVSAILQSPPTRSAPAPAALVSAALALFGYRPDELDPRLPPSLIHGGADHLLLALSSRAALAAMHYDLAAGRQLMQQAGLVTIVLAHAESAQRFHTRNPFASGGVYEDPATGAATAALAGYLRDIAWPHGGVIDVVQGEDMGMRSRLRAEIPPELGSSIRVSGLARVMDDDIGSELTPTPDPVMRHDVAFLHTSAVHVPTFDQLMQELAPALHVTHTVCEALLAQAQRDGVDSPPLLGAVRQAMTQASATGAAVVVCTCSTLGGMAETMETRGAFTAMRVDRAMADQAVSTGQPILLVAALESTLAPTMALLQTSAQRLGVALEVDNLVVREAWPHFTAGDHANYIDTIVKAVSNNAGSRKLVVLAQASMAPAAAALAKLGITALSSPRLGVEQAIALQAKSRAAV